MRRLRGVPSASALVLLAVGGLPASAAWDNVFQVCCHRPGRVAVSGYLPDPCCNPCPQPVCTTQYVQRCYYQPVVTYQTRSYYEPVTTYRTSYYYEPVTTYSYSCYYDPCSCSYQQVACPTVSYRLRAQCCPVQSWVQRCCQVPVTGYQQVSYYEPVTTCQAPPAPAPCNGIAAPVGGTAPPPTVTEQPPAQPAPGVRESGAPGRGGNGSPAYERYYPLPQSAPAMPPASPSRLPATAPPRAKLEGIVVGPAAEVQGRVVSRDNRPRAGTVVVFVSPSQRGREHPVTANRVGKFRVALASGEWLVYVKDADAKPVLNSHFTVRDNETRNLTLVSR